MSKRIGIRHVRMHRFNDTAMSRAHRPYTVGISFEPVLYLGRAQACHRKYGNALSAAADNAAEFVSLAIQQTPADQDTRYGVWFEPLLPRLCPVSWND